MPRFKVTAPDGSVHMVTAPEGTPEDQVLAYAQRQFSAQPTQPTGPPTKFMQESPDVEASRHAENLETLGRYGEHGARFLRDASALTAATLGSRYLGGGLPMQALSRILASGGLGAATGEGGVTDRAKQAALQMGGTGVLETIMGAPGAALSAASGMRTGLGRLGSLMFRKGVPGGGIGSEELGTATKQYLKDVPSLYSPTGQVLKTQAVPAPMLDVGGAGATRDVLQWGRDITKDPRALRRSPEGLIPAGIKSGVGAIGAENPEITLGGTLGLMQYLFGEHGGGDR